MQNVLKCCVLFITSLTSSDSSFKQRLYTRGRPLDSSLPLLVSAPGRLPPAIRLPQRPAHSPAPSYFLACSGVLPPLGGLVILVIIADMVVF